MTPAQFDSKLGVTLKAGEARYTIPYPTTYDWRTFNFFDWLQDMSSVQTTEGRLFAAATFNGVDEELLIVAKSANFETAILAADGVAVV
jgi:hypothetical protein